MTLPKRKRIPTATETEVLTLSGRRCCICFGLNGDFAVQRGQITHLDHDPSNWKSDNLAWMCLNHHDEYDSRTSQSKGYTISEAKKYRAQLYKAKPDKLDNENPQSSGVPKSQNPSANNLLDRDRAVYKKLIELLPWDGSIRFIRQKDFGGGAFQIQVRLIDLYKFQDERLNPAFKFADPKLEKARIDLLNKIDHFLKAIAYYTFPVEGSANQDGGFYSKVPPEWEFEQPERFREAVRQLNQRRTKVCKSYDSLIGIFGDRPNIS